jgi:hypothetical protein
MHGPVALKDTVERPKPCIWIDQVMENAGAYDLIEARP